MRIAIIGTGISGLVAAYRLHSQHDIVMFEANSYVGGHTNTVHFELNGEQHSIDTGFIVFNDRTYPNFIALLNELGIASDPTSMSFSVRAERNSLEYNGTNLNGLFAQRRNLFRPKFYRMLQDILRFNHEAEQLLEDAGVEPLTVKRFLDAHRYSKEFVNYYLLPMGAAIWSCPPATFESFPMRFIAEFYHHHGLLSIRNRPTWRVIRGGSDRYVAALTEPFRNQIRLNTPVNQVQRGEQEVIIQTSSGDRKSFDEVIFACHSDQALKILGDQATPSERAILTSFPYNDNTAVLHTDTSLLPRRKRAWASWNYHLCDDCTRYATVTYNMNILQHIESKRDFLVTLNEEELIDPAKIIRKMHYSHPVFTTERAQVQSRHHELIRHHRTSFCGAYWGNGFHEDGVNSALAVCRKFEKAPLRLETDECVTPDLAEIAPS